MKIEIDKNITLQSLEIELLKIKQELSKIGEENIERDRKLNELLKGTLGK